MFMINKKENTNDLLNPLGFDVADEQKSEPREKPKDISIGDMVNYYSNGQNDEGIISYPAVVVSVNAHTNAAMLQVFLESHIAAYTKVTKCSKEFPEAGSYSCRD